MNAMVACILVAVTLHGALGLQNAPGQAASAGAACPVSVPNGNVAPGWNPDDYFADAANVSVDEFYGNGSIFVHLQEGDQFLALQERQGEGGWNKFVFYRLPIGADFEAVILPFGWKNVGEPARADPSPGQEQFIYQVFGVWFPSEGCWQIRARSNGTMLSIVLDVVFVDSWNPTHVAPRGVGPVA